MRIALGSILCILCLSFFYNSDYSTLDNIHQTTDGTSANTFYTSQIQIKSTSAEDRRGIKIKRLESNLIYTDSELLEKKKTYTEYIKYVFEVDLISKLPSHIKSKISNVTLHHPLRVVLSDPLFFSANSKLDTITIPLQTIAFWDDISEVGAVFWTGR